MSISIFRSSGSARTFGPRPRKPVAISRSCDGRASPSAGGEQVARELFEDELVVGLVAVEGGDDVVAVAPGVAVGDVLVEAVGVGVAGQVEPVPAPALAVLGRGEQPLDDPGEGVRGHHRRGSVDLLGGRRQAGQVEGRPPDQGPPVGRGGRRRPLASSAARMNRSSGDRGQRGSATPGTGGSAGGRNAQWLRPCSRLTLVAPVESGKNPPRLTQRVRSAISCPFSFSLGGIRGVIPMLDQPGSAGSSPADRPPAGFPRSPALAEPFGRIERRFDFRFSGP